MYNWIDRKVYFLNEYQSDTAIFIDLFPKESIELGISLARIGYRPVPLFNGTDEQENSYATTDTYLAESSLITQFIISKTPAGRWGTTDDLVGPAVFLASDASDFVNGHILYVDGGILAYIGKQP